jgi:hypothetical protein
MTIDISKVKPGYKVIRDGKVGVVLRMSRYASHDIDRFSPRLIAEIEAGDHVSRYGMPLYVVEWVPLGTKFFVNPCEDGDDILIDSEIDWIEA